MDKNLKKDMSQFSYGMIFAFGIASLTNMTIGGYRDASRVYQMDLNKDSIQDVVVENGFGQKKLFLGQQGGNYKKIEEITKEQAEQLEKTVQEALQQK